MSRERQATIQKVARMVLSRSPKNQLNIANHPDVRDPNKLQAMLRDAFFKALPLMGAIPRGDARAMNAAMDALITDVYVEYPNSFTGDGLVDLKNAINEAFQATGSSLCI